MCDVSESTSLIFPSVLFVLFVFLSHYDLSFFCGWLVFHSNRLLPTLEVTRTCHTCDALMFSSHLSEI